MSAWVQTTVDVAPLRQAFVEKDIDLADLAREHGVYKASGQADGNYFARMLGLRPYWPGHGYPPRLRERISHNNARMLADSIGVDPVDVGI